MLNNIAMSSFNQNIGDISQVNMKRLIRDVGEEEVMKLLKQVIKNNLMLLKLQKPILQVVKDQKKRRE